MFAVFRVKNHDFTPKNLIFSNFRGGGGGGAPGAPLALKSYVSDTSLEIELEFYFKKVKYFFSSNYKLRLFVHEFLSCDFLSYIQIHMIAYSFQYCSLLWCMSICIVICYSVPVTCFRIILVHLEYNV